TLSNDSYRLSLAGYNSGNTYTLTYGGQTTGSIAWNANANTVQTALTGLGSVGTGNATVTGAVPGVLTITFVGALGHGASTPLTFNNAGLTGLNGANSFQGGHNEFLCDQYGVFAYHVATGANTLVSHA